MHNFGISGDTIVFNEKTITKICETNQNRFVKNAEKQKLFDNEIIKTPLIIKQGSINNKNFIEMQRLKCDNCLVWISKHSIEEINNLGDLFIDYFHSLLNDSKLVDFDYYLWQQKINDLEANIIDKEVLNYLATLKKLQFTNKLYIGNYHGDFTLSNLFIFDTPNKPIIYAIDFLDTFISSPINDVVKLRQDTKHLWSLNLANDFSETDKNKVILFLRYIDAKIEQFINESIILQEYYLPLQMLNLIRIIPYINDDKILLYLKQEIRALANDFDRTTDNIDNVMCG